MSKPLHFAARAVQKTPQPPDHPQTGAQQLATGRVHELYFYDDIEKYGEFNWATWEYDDAETSAKHVRDVLQQIPAGDPIEVHINSCGGDVGEGTTIYNLLRQKAQDGCTITAYVDGYAYSVAMTIAMACDEIHMGLGTSMFLHRPWGGCVGNADDMRAAAERLDVLTEASLQLYLNRCKDLTEEQLREMMVKETMLSPEDALQYGFCDVIDTYTAQLPADPPEQQSTDNASQQLAEIREMLSGLQKARNQTPAEPADKPTLLDALAQAFMKGE